MTCFLLHGFLGEKEDFRALSALLSHKYTCIALDLPEENYLEALYQEIKKASISPSILIGYSLGGRLALQLADQYPDSFSHVIILAANPGLENESEREPRFAKDLQWIEKLKTQSIDSFLIDWYNQPLFNSLHKRPELLQEIIKKRARQDPARMAEVLEKLSVAKQKTITSFHPRTLFLYGEEDVLFEKRYATLPKDVTVQKIENSGHVVHLENPRRCAEIILGWLS